MRTLPFPVPPNRRIGFVILPIFVNESTLSNHIVAKYYLFSNCSEKSNFTFSVARGFGGFSGSLSLFFSSFFFSLSFYKRNNLEI